MTDAFVRTNRERGVTELILDRPQRRNALVGPMLEQLTDAVRTLSGDGDTRVILFRGEGGAFCSGHDLKELQAEPRPAWADSLAKIFRETNIALFECPKPIVGALEGFAINAGAALALSCDILIAGHSAFLQVGEIQQGAGIANNAAWMRLRAGEGVALRMALYGERVPAPELYRLGLATEVVEDADVLARASAIATKIAAFPNAVRTKADVRAQAGIHDARAWFREQSSNVLLRAGRVS
jgi:enoyl-CoA hydratase/carnithine racemase